MAQVQHVRRTKTKAYSEKRERERELPTHHESLINVQTETTDKKPRIILSATHIQIPYDEIASDNFIVSARRGAISFRESPSDMGLNVRNCPAFVRDSNTTNYTDRFFLQGQEMRTKRRQQQYSQVDSIRGEERKKSGTGQKS